MKTNKIHYLLKGTPSVLLVLGAGFVMASSADLRAALAMSAAVFLSLFISSAIVAAIHKIVPSYAKLPAYLLIITGVVSILSMFMQAYFPVSTGLLGVHLATLSVSAVIYRDNEEIADHAHTGKTTVMTALVTGAFFTVVMVVCALIREVLGNASILGISIPFLSDYKVSILASTFGGYLVLAIVLAVIKKILAATHKEEN